MRYQDLFINGNKKFLNVYIADKFWARLRGWLGKKQMPEDGLLILPCNSVHTFLMKFPIDVAFLNFKNQVISLHENVAPNKILWPVKEAKGVLELPPGTIARLAIKAGDFVTLT
jgi:uncharacterized membrane protein (UPF0127 family)